MDAHQEFRQFILPKLLATAQQLGCLDYICSISLYGSRNYRPDKESLEAESARPEKRDYDIWIVFKRDSLREAKRFATELFGTSFLSLPNQPECILYDKILLRIQQREFLLAPMIVMEECYESLRNTPKNENGHILIPWYRPRARERPPKVPVCSAEYTWSEFDLQQTYLPEANIWRLMMPVIVNGESGSALGTFVECTLSGDCFYGDCRKEDELKKNLFLEAIRQFRLTEALQISDIPSALYRMLTLETKAGPHFKEAKLQQFSQWLSK